MAVETKTTLRRLREELKEPKVSQEAMARKVGVSLQWYRLLEKGQQQRTSFTTARQLVAVINAERQVRGLDVIDLNHIGLMVV